jgi:hypothetical protein
MWLPGSHKVNAFMGNIANETESMDVTTLPWSDAGFYPSAAGNVKQPRGPFPQGMEAASCSDRMISSPEIFPNRAR